MWVLYELLFAVGLLFYVPRAIWRRRLPHPGWTMRLGRYPTEVRQRLADGRSPIWLHAVSVGEVRAAEPLVQLLRQEYPQERLTLSTTTAGGYAVASAQVGERGSAVYCPLDLGWCVRWALDAIHPRLLLLMEAEFWPRLIHLTKARGIPIIVINGRISARAFRRYRWIKPWLGGLMFNDINLFLMQSQRDAERLLQLGVPTERVRVVGSLKWDASLSARPTAEAVRAAAGRLGLNGSEAVVVAGSTHRGEERLLLEAFQRLHASRTGLRLIIAPRHVERVAEVERLIQRAGLTAARLSQASAAAWDVGLVDTVGQLPLYYGLADAVFIGGSLIPHGGQNPLEAASLGKPILFGPSMHNFAEIAEALLTDGAARQLAGGEELADTLDALLTKRPLARAMGERAQALTERCRGTSRGTLELLRPFLVP